MARNHLHLTLTKPSLKNRVNWFIEDIKEIKDGFMVGTSMLYWAFYWGWKHRK
jgi:hypothetical protein